MNDKKGMAREYVEHAKGTACVDWHDMRGIATSVMNQLARTCAEQQDMAGELPPACTAQQHVARDEPA